jgi:hypothetical protein
MSKTTPEQNKAIVREASETLFNKRRSSRPSVADSGPSSLRQLTTRL